MHDKIQKQVLGDVTLQKAMRNLFSVLSLFPEYESLQKLILDSIEDSAEAQDKYRKFFGIFQECLEKLLTPYRREDFFPSTSIAAEVFFSAIKSNTGNIKAVLLQFFEELTLYKLTNSALVVFPVYSFSILDAGIPSFFRKQNLHFEMRDLVLFPQHNSIEYAIKTLNFAKDHFKMKNYSLDIDLIHHFCRARPLEWFKRNQLLICKINFSSTDYFENQFFLTRQLERSVCKIYFANILIKMQRQISLKKGIETGIINNSETRDIKHYLVFEKKGTKLTPSCIPMWNELSDAVELSNLRLKMPISCDAKTQIQIEQAGLFVDKVFKNCVPAREKVTQEQVFYEKLRISFLMFARSCQARFPEDEALYLAAAFEGLYAEGKKENVTYIVNRNLGCLAQKNDADDIIRNFKLLYNARSQFAHEGKMVSKCDLAKCREIYLGSIFKIEKLIRSKSLNLNSKTPISDYVNDILIQRIGFTLKV